jgi:hypothetical protein
MRRIVNEPRWGKRFVDLKNPEKNQENIAGEKQILNEIVVYIFVLG